MTTARSLLVAAAPGTYHCVQRCVRRAFLCGVDDYSGRSFEHRKDWLVTRLHLLADCFAVGILGYAVMSNHLHVVLRLDAAVVAGCSDDELARRWVMLFPPRDDCEGARRLKQQALAANAERMALIRQRLASLSWFMRCLAEPIARRANLEDQVTGRFWQGRFRCQALLDDRAVLAALAYVDLNPIRAGIADRLEDSAQTSVQQRINIAQRDPSELRQPMRALLGLQVPVLPLSLADYLQLLDWTGRTLHPGKRGAISAQAPAVLDRLGIAESRWTREVRAVGSDWHRAIGGVTELIELARALGQCWLRGIGFARALGLS